MKKKTIPEERYLHLLSELQAIPEKVKELLHAADHIRSLAEKYKNVGDALYLGRGNNFPVALEGALKLKEISYIHAEGYPAAEMKHGPIALVTDKLPVLFAAPKSLY